jgi:hypothetical protein
MAEARDEIDELFDRFTEGKGGRRYQDGFTEENWEEVLAFFRRQLGFVLKNLFRSFISLLIRKWSECHCL